MKLYDKIWIPVKTQGLAFRDKEGDTPSILAGPVIVLSIEELKELWSAGAQHGYESDFGGTAPDLTAYLQSKGISI